MSILTTKQPTNHEHHYYYRHRCPQRTGLPSIQRSIQATEGTLQLLASRRVQPWWTYAPKAGRRVGGHHRGELPTGASRSPRALRRHVPRTERLLHMEYRLKTTQTIVQSIVLYYTLWPNIKAPPNFLKAYSALKKIDHFS